MKKLGHWVYEFGHSFEALYLGSRSRYRSETKRNINIDLSSIYSSYFSQDFSSFSTFILRSNSKSGDEEILSVTRGLTNFLNNVSASFFRWNIYREARESCNRSLYKYRCHIPGIRGLSINSPNTEFTFSARFDAATRACNTRTRVASLQTIIGGYTISISPVPCTGVSQNPVPASVGFGVTN